MFNPNIIILISTLLALSNGLFVSQLYPFGSQNGDIELPAQIEEDVSSSEIRLNTPVKFFDREYKSIFVSAHIVSFIKP